MTGRPRRLVALCAVLVSGGLQLKLLLAASATQTLTLHDSEVDNSLVRELTECDSHVPNRRARQVFSGHYVRVAPLPLPNPVVAAVTPLVAAMVGIALPAPDAGTGDRFVDVFSGAAPLGPADGTASSWQRRMASRSMARPCSRAALGRQATGTATGGPSPSARWCTADGGSSCS